MTTYGFHSSHEQIHPAELLKAVTRAEQAGFGAAMSSDHFSPWSERQGQSGFAWSWLGAALQATELPFGVVNAPGQRYHPAIIAQAIGTLGRDVPRTLLGRARLGRGEQRAGHRRPLAAQGAPLTRACASASTSSGRCWPARRSATTAWSPSTAPACGPARTPAQAGRPGGQRRDGARCAEWADGLITVNGPLETLREVLGAYRDAGGAGTAALQVHLSWADDRRGGPGDRPRPVAEQRLLPAGVLGPRDRRALRRDLRRRPAGARSPRSSTSPATWAGTPPGSTSTRSWASRRLSAPRRPGAECLHRRLRCEGAAPAPLTARGLPEGDLQGEVGVLPGDMTLPLTFATFGGNKYFVINSHDWGECSTFGGGSAPIERRHSGSPSQLIRGVRRRRSRVRGRVPAACGPRERARSPLDGPPRTLPVGCRRPRRRLRTDHQ